MLPFEKQIYVYFLIKKGKSSNSLQQYNKELQRLSVNIKKYQIILSIVVFQRKSFSQSTPCSYDNGSMLPFEKRIYVYFHIKNGKDTNYLQEYDRKLQRLSICVKIS